MGVHFKFYFNCAQDKIKATTVVKKFASGLGSLLAELVSGLTSPPLPRTSPRKAGRNKRKEREEDEGLESEQDPSAESDEEEEDDEDFDEEQVKKQFVR